MPLDKAYPEKALHAHDCKMGNLGESNAHSQQHWYQYGRQDKPYLLIHSVATLQNRTVFDWKNVVMTP